MIKGHINGESEPEGVVVVGGLGGHPQAVVVGERGLDRLGS